MFVIEDLQWQPHWDPTRKRIKPFQGNYPDVPKTLSTTAMLRVMEKALPIISNSNIFSTTRRNLTANLLKLNKMDDSKDFPFVEEVKEFLQEIDKITIYRNCDFKTSDRADPRAYIDAMLCIIEKKV